MELKNLVAKLAKTLIAKKIMLVTVESCTGGMVSEAVTSISGSSDWFDRGFITYSNAAKIEMLGVSQKKLAKFGAVSEAVAAAMAEGALKNSKAQISLAVTGIAGPSGGTQEKPVGTVCFAWAQTNHKTLTKTKHFKGNRTKIRQQATLLVLDHLLSIIK